MAKIFISYNSRDREYAVSLATKLRELGHEVAFDIDSISPGMDWRKTLSQSLKRSDIFVSLITENSLESQYVTSEIGAAMAYAEAGSSMLVVPVVIGDIAIPSFIQHINALHVRVFDLEYIVSQIERAFIAFSGRKAAEEEKASEVQNRIETNVADYIDEAMKRLCETETRGRRAGLFWYVLGYISLLGGVAFAAIALTRLETLDVQTHWLIPSLIALKSVVIVGLLIASSKYCFMLGRAHTAEAHKNSDRSHAISFGKFYLKAFGAKADWNQLKEVFQHWNIDRASTFSALLSDEYDPKFVQSVKELTAAVTSLKNDASRG